MGKLAITGITGKNGKFLYDEIKNNKQLIGQTWDGIKFNIHTLQNGSFISQDDFDIPIEIVVGSLQEEKTVMNLLKECDTCLHIAGIQCSLNIVKAAIKNHVERLILVHTTGIYSKYKSAGEEYRKIDKKVYDLTGKYKIKLTILRPTMIYGTTTDRNISVFIKMVDKFKVMPTVNGAHYELQPVHCADLGKAFYQVLINSDVCNGKDYVLSGGEPIELRKIFEEIAKNLGVKRRYISCPFPIAYIGAWIVYIVTLRKKDYREKVQRLCEPRVFSYAEAKKDFGYSPRIFQEGIVQEVKDYMKEKK